MLSPFTGARAGHGQPGIMANGDLAVTGFSGTKEIGGQTFIDTNGASLKIFDVSGKGQARGQLIGAPAKFEAFARDIGQVFGVALDNAPQPNIYVTPTTALGMQIVIPDNNGDGIPERVTTGQPGAMFMDGQFGTALGGGPGTIWRIDGATGEITLFADVKLGGTPNSGPGLGNIAFDPAHYQLYVSDKDTGFIHRFDLAGNDLGTFDHGAQGRPAAGLAPVIFNFADRMDITNPAFDATDSNTWNLADNQRRVWGLAYFSGRLYYGVGDGPQIWSVGINTDGGFANDARVEIQTVPGGFPVSDILFTPRGRMILSQRGGIQGSQNYTKYQMPKDNRVLRYSRDETGAWIQMPEEYAIGFPVDYKNASGGVALACDGTLWSSGDALRNDPALAASLLPGGPLVVHGLQGNKLSLVRPFNAPPKSSWFVDYDGQFADPEKAGHVGDVEVYRDCPGGRAESFPGWYPVPEWYPPEGWVPPVWWPETPDLDLEKIASECVEAPGLFASFLCKYTVVLTNIGAGDFVGQLHVVDNPPATAVYIPPPGGSIPWNCSQPGGAGSPISCDSTNVETLHPGESETLEITIQVLPGNVNNIVRNCAILDQAQHGDDPGHHGIKEDCAEAELPRPDLEIDKTLWDCQPEGAGQRCFFVLSFENVGGGPYSGALHFAESFPAGTIFGGIWAATTPGWGCVGGNPVNCTLPDPPGVTMNPGDIEQVGISIIVPAGVGGDMENCVSLGNPTHAGDPAAPGANSACEPFTVAQPMPVPPLAPNPVVPKCPAGWSPVPPGGAPAGWQVISVHGINPDGSNWAMLCMRPQPKKPLPLAPKPPAPKCPVGWVPVPPGGAPAGWQVVAVDGVNPDGSKWGIMCMKPQPKKPLPLAPNPVVPKCPSGWTKVPPQGAPKGYKVIAVDGINPDGSKWGIMCMKPKPNVLTPLPFCAKGETRYQSKGKVPKGWTSRKVTLGNSTIYCAKPRVLIPRPFCAKGETRYQSKGQVPKGWTSRKVTLGNSTIYCAKPRVLITPGPSQVGPSRPEFKAPKVKPCPRGWSRTKNGGCQAPKLQIRPKLQLQPQIKPCPRGWSRVNGTCIAPRPKPKAKPQLRINPNLKVIPKAKPVTRLNRSLRLNRSGNATMFR